MLTRVIAQFEKEVTALNIELSMGSLRKLEVTVLGQQGLLIRQEKLPSLTLLATTDFDGLLNGEPPLEDVFKRMLREEGFTYDEQSKYVWLPDETTYEVIHDSKIIEVKSPLPIYLIVSKAVKAPEKNKQLVIQALTLFGERLIALLDKYEVDIAYFVGK